MPLPAKIFGYPIRQPYDGEHQYFRQNRNVTGMAAEDGAIVLNPYSMLNEQQQLAVARNEAVRHHLTKNQYKYDFDPTPEQLESFKGTPYAQPGNDYHLRSTLLARIISGDPSAGNVTQRQREWADWLMKERLGTE